MCDKEVANPSTCLFCLSLFLLLDYQPVPVLAPLGPVTWTLNELGYSVSPRSYTVLPSANWPSSSSIPCLSRTLCLLFWTSTCSFKPRAKAASWLFLLPMSSSISTEQLPEHPESPSQHTPQCQGQGHQGCRTHHCPGCPHPLPLLCHAPLSYNRTPQYEKCPQEETKGPGPHSVHRGTDRRRQERPEEGGHLWEKVASVRRCS